MERPNRGVVGRGGAATAKSAPRSRRGLPSPHCDGCRGVNWAATSDQLQPTIGQSAKSVHLLAADVRKTSAMQSAEVYPSQVRFATMTGSFSGTAHRHPHIKCAHFVIFCLSAQTLLQILYILPRVVTCCHILSHFLIYVDYGKLQHFCDDPVCPHPVWKLSSRVGGRSRGRSIDTCAEDLPVGSAAPRRSARRRASDTDNLRTKILVFRGFEPQHNLDCKGWSSHVHREFPGNVESTNLSRDDLSGEIGRRA